MLVIGAAFYLVAFSTVRLVGDALFSDAIRSHAAQTQNLAAALGEKLRRARQGMFPCQSLRGFSFLLFQSTGIPDPHSMA